MHVNKCFCRLQGETLQRQVRAKQIQLESLAAEVSDRVERTQRSTAAQDPNVSISQVPTIRHSVRTLSR